MCASFIIQTYSMHYARISTFSFIIVISTNYKLILKYAYENIVIRKYSSTLYIAVRIVHFR